MDSDCKFFFFLRFLLICTISDQSNPHNKSSDGLGGLNRKVEALKNDNLEMAVLI